MPDPADDLPHEAGAGSWEESWLFDAVDPDGVGVTVRYAFRPFERAVRWWTYVLRPGTGPVVVRDHDVVPPRGGTLEIRADGLWAELVPETPLEHWAIGLEAFGVQLDDPDDALHGELGHRVPVGGDLEFELSGPPEPPPWGTSWAAAGFVQPGRLHGEILVGDERLVFDGVARRTRAWGMPPWPPGWARAWSAEARDGTGARDAVGAALGIPAGTAHGHRLVVPLDPSVDGGAALERAVTTGVAVGWAERLLPG